MICDFPKWWSFLTYDGFKSHVNATDALKTFSEERIKVGKEGAGTSDFNQAYDKFQAKQDKAQIGWLAEARRAEKGETAAAAGDKRATGTEKGDPVNPQ